MPRIHIITKIIDIEGWKIIRLPQNASKAFSSRGMVMAKGILNGIHFETALEPDGAGSHWFRLSDGLLEKATSDVGDAVSLMIEQTDAWVEPVIPKDLMSSLEFTGLKDQWSQLTARARWEWIRWIRFTKNPSTREKRIKTLNSMLKAGKKRPCCFDYSRCTETSVSKNGILLNHQDT